MDVFAGTSGFSYKEWKGVFYPEDLPANQMLRFYSEKLPAVEINNTFYRLPKKSMLEGWVEQVSGEFQFVLKASRRITHFKRLKETEDETSYLFDTVQALGARLGVILFQLPPNLKKDIERLERFLKLIPESVRAAFEFRHESWMDQEVFDRLRSKPCALCLADTDEGDPDIEIPSTASWGYLRLRRADYDENQLASWCDRIRSTGWERAYVFFKHEDAGAGPKMAGRFLELFTSKRK